MHAVFLPGDSNAVWQPWICRNNAVTATEYSRGNQISVVRNSGTLTITTESLSMCPSTKSLCGPLLR